MRIQNNSYRTIHKISHTVDDFTFMGCPFHGCSYWMITVILVNADGHERVHFENDVHVPTQDYNLHHIAIDIFELALCIIMMDADNDYISYGYRKKSM